MAIDIEKSRLPAVKPGAEVSAASTADGGAPTGWRAHFTMTNERIGPRERMFFTERLSLLLDTGVPLHVALESIARQADAGAMARLIQEVNEDVKGGTSFARALGSHETIFPPTYVNLVAAAEVGGFLPVALDRLRDMEERREDLRSTLVSAVSYPAVLTVFSLAVVVFVLVVVFPKFADIFEAIHDQLPITTRWLMATSDVLRDRWIFLVVGLGGTAFAVSRWVARPEGAAFFDRAMLAIPGLRDIVVQLNVVQLLRVMGLSLGNGVGMVEALRSAREAVASPTFRRLLERVEQGIHEGRGLHHGFNDEAIVPDLVKQMIETGEESGNLPVVMIRLADFYEREWRRALGLIAKIAEPAMLVIMGGVVGLSVSSLILPIFKLSRAVH